MNFFRLNAGNSRIFGLDLLRFFAIMFVVVGHSKILLPEKYKDIVDDFLLDGVSIFFVLSGFLIGGILIKQLEKQPASGKLLINFWNRRWLRTLPAYILVLTFLVIYTYLLKPERLPSDWYKYYLFIQNFNVPQPPFFSESWSLSIEEWFYLLIPLALFSGLILFKTSVRTMIIWVLGIGTFAVIAYRYYIFQTASLSSFKEVDLAVMRQVLTRLDAIMIGVAGAFAAFYFPKVWARGSHFILAAAAVGALYFMKFHIPGYTSQYYVVWLPLLKSLAVLAMLPFLSQWKTVRWKVSRVVTFISLVSYSMYLINRTVVIDICIKFGLDNNLKHKHVIDENWQWEYLLFWFLTISLSFLLYKLVEMPFMQLRKKEK